MSEPESIDWGLLPFKQRRLLCRLLFAESRRLATTEARDELGMVDAWLLELDDIEDDPEGAIVQLIDEGEYTMALHQSFSGWLYVIVRDGRIVAMGPGVPVTYAGAEHLAWEHYRQITG